MIHREEGGGKKVGTIFKIKRNREHGVICHARSMTTHLSLAMGMNVSRVRTKFEFFDKFRKREREEKK